jgi:hypothetical protein
MLRTLLILFCLRAVCCEPRLVASVQAPQDSLGVWVRGNRFGTEGMWNYNLDPMGQNWCWNGPDGSSYFSLPKPGLIEHVDPLALTALVEDDHQRWFLWKPGAGGVYQSIPTAKKRYHGSENFPPTRVHRPALQRIYELDHEEVQICETKSHRILYRRKLNSPYTLALAGQTLAVADEDAVFLFSAGDLKLAARLPVRHVKSLALDSSGKRLALLDLQNQIRVYEVSPQVRPVDDLGKQLWNGHNLTPEAFRTLALRWAARAGKSWWQP